MTPRKEDATNVPRLGVTGHRFLANEEILRVSVKEAIAAIAKYFSSKPMIVLSSLAEGSDRLVTTEVLSDPAARLIAVLPMAQPSYMTDFLSDASKQEFLELLRRAVQVVELPSKPERNASYESGRQELGRGGTGAIVSRARALGLPIAWIHAGNRKPGSLEPTSLGGKQGVVTLEGFETKPEKH